jgi:hypothetical protein
MESDVRMIDGDTQGMRVYCPPSVRYHPSISRSTMYILESSQVDGYAYECLECHIKVLRPIGPRLFGGLVHLPSCLLVSLPFGLYGYQVELA